MSTTLITCDGAELYSIVQRIESVVIGELESNVFMALIAMATTIHNPGLSGPDLVEAVRRTAEFMSGLSFPGPTEIMN